MHHVRSLGFESLEARQLLTHAHHAVVHPVAAVATVPLVLQGTLTVDNSAAATTMNADGSTTTAVPVAGVLGALGKVRGFWNENTNVMGDYQGPDTIVLRDPQGMFIIAFNNATPGKAHKLTHGVYFEHPQRVEGGTGAYVRASESGTIELNTNNARTVIESLTLNAPTT